MKCLMRKMMYIYGLVALVSLFALLAPEAAGQKTRSQRPRDQVVRAIDDAALGMRWTLIRNTEHPEGPARLVPAAFDPAERVEGRPVPAAAGSRAAPVIHAGDHLVLEEHTAVAESRLEAVALDSAQPGALVRVRLSIGGQVVRAVAVGSGLAMIRAEGTR
jgi:hypothetical protein